jgi:hypothetical protein
MALAAHSCYPTGGYHCTHALAAALIEWPIGDRTLGLIVTSGWVMKNTVALSLWQGRGISSPVILDLREAVTQMCEYRFAKLSGGGFARSPSNLTLSLLGPI